jgi:hypothetical protein
MFNQNDNNASFASPEGRAWLKSMLRVGPADITFIKKDGTERVMSCTLQEGHYVPHERTTDNVKEENPNTLPVWDIEKAAWRSFRLDTIKQVRFDL